IKDYFKSLFPFFRGSLVNLFFRGSGKYLSTAKDAIAISKEPTKVVVAKNKLPSNALLSAPNKNQICMLMNRICNTIMPVIIVLVFLGCASFCAPLKLLICYTF